MTRGAQIQCRDTRERLKWITRPHMRTRIEASLYGRCETPGKTCPFLPERLRVIKLVCHSKLMETLRKAFPGTAKPARATIYSKTKRDAPYLSNSSRKSSPQPVRAQEVQCAMWTYGIKYTQASKVGEPNKQAAPQVA